MNRIFRPISIVTALAFLFCVASVSEARPRKKTKRSKAYKKPNQKAMGSLMGGYSFGSSSSDVKEIIIKKIKKRYHEKVLSTSDVYTQDKLRKKEKEEIAGVKRSITKFDGKKSGWDVSLIDDQFAHKTGESVMVHWENHDGRDQRRFFFFHNNRLYKMLLSLSTKKLKKVQRSFAYFEMKLQSMFGKGKVLIKADSKGNIAPFAIDWRTPKYHFMALDKLNFYGAFCLVIAEPKMEKDVDAERARNPVAKKKIREITRQVVRGEGDTPDLDEGADTIDGLIKKK